MAREMKDSGIAWIGEIPVSWTLQRMKSCIASRESGAWGDEPDNTVGDVICLRIADFDYERFRFKNTKISELTKRHYKKEVIERLILKENDILIEKSGGGEKTPVGRTVLFDKTYQALYANFMDRLRCVAGVNPLFMQYVLVTFYKNEYTRNYIKQTTGIQNLDLTAMLSNEVIPLPSLVEQQRVADFLDKECARIDAVIEHTRQSIEEYKKLKQSIITEAVTKGIRPNRPMKDSGIEWIGEIASDFDLQKLKYVSKILDQFRSPITADQRNQDAEVLYDYYGASGAIDKINGYTIDDHVMLIGEDGANLRMRNLPLMYEVNGKAWINNHAHILKPKENTHFNYLFYVLEAIDINPYITGSAQPKLSQENLKNIWLPVPSFEEQAEIAEYLQIKIPKIDELIDQKHQFLSELESYKKSLIYEYVTGKKEVSV
ncbi:MAG: hypothetical protein E7517_07425 [Ruminococcaceae bacterium]|nr:hypothetical protein [Oscillospiraceae bacterium]